MFIYRKRYGTHPSRSTACKAIKKYCKMTRCHKKKHNSSSKYSKRACRLTRKICKYTTCKSHRVVKK